MSESQSSTGILEILKPTTASEELGNVQKYFQLNTWQYLIILGIAVSGLAAFVTTYDAWSNINKNYQACAQTGTLQDELKTQFIVITVLSCFAVILGLILAWFFRKNENPRQLLTLGIMTTGLFGIIYALTIKFQDVDNKINVALSWITFIGFLVLGWYFSRKKTTETTIINE